MLIWPLMVAAVLVASWIGSKTLSVDACLDRGGCWDAVDRVCRHDEPGAQALCDRSLAVPGPSAR